MYHLSRPPHFGPQPGPPGWQWGVGGKPLNRAKVCSQQKNGRLFADCRPHRPLSFFAWYKRLGILYVNSKKCKENWNRPGFDQVMTYLAKYEIVILAEV
jgi:hypothetical protein